MRTSSSSVKTPGSDLTALRSGSDLGVTDVAGSGQTEGADRAQGAGSAAAATAPPLLGATRERGGEGGTSRGPASCSLLTRAEEAAAGDPARGGDAAGRPSEDVDAGGGGAPPSITHGLFARALLWGGVTLPLLAN
jgi:hypothetical protein